MTPHKFCDVTHRNCDLAEQKFCDVTTIYRVTSQNFCDVTKNFTVTSQNFCDVTKFFSVTSQNFCDVTELKFPLTCIFTLKLKFECCDVTENL